VLGFAGPLTTQTHDGQLELFNAGILFAPLGHGGAEVALDLLSEFLKISACRPAAAGATRYLRHEAADPERLQNLLGGLHFFCAVAAGLGVRLTRMVSPMPASSSGARPAVEAIRPLEPMQLR